MTTPFSPAELRLGLVAGAVLLTVAACGGTTEPTPGASGSVGSGAAPASSASTAAGSAAPSSSPGSPGTAAPSSTSSGATGGGVCAVGRLRVRYAVDVGGGGAGSVAGKLTFTNTGSAACTLRGFPGVSYVGGGDGTQVGQAATRTDDAVKTRTLAPGKAVSAALRRAQPGSYGSGCQETAVDGFRVYPPDSTESVFVAFKATGCRSTTAPLLQVGPVR